ncbi:MAG TPA: hypothetical protein VMZ53_12175 [Kofleriaceae bacterium]|nr:hypothetical protein [Kofleriaceae bacterium]
MMNKLAASLFVFAVGCASATDGAFHVSGRVDDARVTHVVAGNPADGSRIIVAIEDGSFNLALPAGKQWVLTFADATKSGSAMQVATLQAGGLDALVPQEGGALDLGLVKMNGARASSTTDFGDIIDALGLSSAEATRMGNVDNLALRVANPDIDNDGFIDERSPLLQVSGTFQVQLGGNSLSMADALRGDYKTASIKYMGTTLIAGVPSSMNMAMKTGTLTFEQPFYGTAMGDSPAIMPGTPIGAPHVKFGQLDGMQTIGLVSRPGHDAPRGTYELGFANGALTFTDVMPPSTPIVESAQSYSVPFVHVIGTDSKCQGSCTIDSIALDWKSLSASGWTQATQQPAHVDIVLERGGKRSYLAADVSGTTMKWQDLDVTNTGLTWNELSYFTTANICYVGVSYESELGMKMTNALYNTGCF